MNQAEVGPRLEPGGTPVYEGGGEGGRKGRSRRGASTILGPKGFKKDEVYLNIIYCVDEI